MTSSSPCTSAGVVSRLILVSLTFVGALVAPARAQTETTASAPTALAPEHQLLFDATKLAAAGDPVGAWELIEAGGTATQIGFRAASVAGFLRNQSKYAEADLFAKLAIEQPWSDTRSLRVAQERGEVRYWCAWLAAEVIGDLPRAAQWAAEAAADDPASEQIKTLRRKLADVEKAFPAPAR